MKLLAGSNTVKGTINDGMDVEFALRLGKAVGKAYGSPIAVAVDGRTSNLMLKTALTSGIMAVGCEVLDLGTVPTPMVQYYMSFHPEIKGGVTITASFSGQEINGFKILKAGGIDDSFFYDHPVEEIRANEIAGVPGLQVGEIHKVEEFVEGYVDYIISEVDADAIRKAGLKICLDCRNTTFIPVAANILMRLSVDCITIGGDTSVLDADRLVKLGHIVKSQGLNLGVAIEMDADHCLFADDKGHPVQGDKSFSLFARHILGEKKGKVVLPINSSTLMENVILENGGLPIHCTVGEYTVVRKVKENDAVLGGDIFGCMVMPGKFCNYDAMIPMVKMLEIIAKSGPISKQIKDMPDCYLSRSSFEYPDSKIPQIIEKFKDINSGKEMDLVEGVKVYVDGGWILVRQSNVKGVVKVYSQGDSKEAADAMVQDTIEKLKA
jgi:phosphomannomutase/phosphoglucomutase